jgi:hypothetical protein
MIVHRYSRKFAMISYQTVVFSVTFPLSVKCRDHKFRNPILSGNVYLIYHIIFKCQNFSIRMRAVANMLSVAIVVF